jgi:hypothetical protein
MFSRTSINVGLVLAVSMLFIMAFAYQASAYSAGGSTPFTYEGIVVELDNAHNIVTVQAGPNDEFSFRLAKDAAVIMCDMTKPFTDLEIGDQVEVSYFEESSGGYIASEVDLLATGLGQC